jgi:phospholipid/cholesterol/gamma-HCH transport system substrate-binding protein
MDRDRNLEIKVGLFVLMGLSLLVFTTVSLGNQQNLFETNVTLHTSFNDIAGLREGAAVKLSGLNVGVVTSIKFPRDLGDKRVQVALKVASRYSERIRGDSTATIKGQGLLGDKFLELTIGSEDRPIIEDGSTIDPIEPSDMFSALGKTAASFEQVADNINKMLTGEDGQSAGKSVAGILASLRNILDEAKNGSGIIHQLVYDKQAGRDLTAAVAAVLSAVVSDVRNGDGTISKLIYQDQISGIVTSLESTVASIDTLVADVKDGDGVIHDLVYGEEQAELVASLATASNDLKDILGTIKRGEGTLGALVVDPTVYGDVKALLGGAQRNKVLKAFVRDTIRKTERGEGLADRGQMP